MAHITSMKPAKLTLFTALPLLLSPSGWAQICAEELSIGPVVSANINDPSGVTDVSDDGEVIVGTAPFGSQPNPITGQLPRRAFRWTAATGMQDLGAFPGLSLLDESWATAVSADGTTVIGYAEDSSGGERFAFRWTAATGMQDLGSLGPAGAPVIASAIAVSADGTVVVGESSDNVSFRPFRWTVQSGMIALGSGSPGFRGRASAVSADGSIVAFNEFPLTTPGFPLPAPAYRWTAQTGAVPLGNYTVVAMSADGESIIGNVPTVSSSNAYRWRLLAGWMPLGGLPASQGSMALDISADGSVVVGSSIVATGLLNQLTSVRWTTEGISELATVAGASSSALVTCVSGDGSVLAGIDAAVGFRVRASAVGTTYCRPAVASSSTCAGLLLVAGPTYAPWSNLELRAELLPPNSTGFFLVSRTQGFAVQPGGSQGNLCLDGAIGRYVGPGQVQSSGAGGGFSLVVGAWNLPTPTGQAVAQPGDTWYFQAWYRDANPNPTSNFTDAVSVTFQ